MSDEFDQANAGSSATRPVQAGSVKKGSFVMLKNRPCKVVEYSTSKTGKHGHAKASITGIDIFTGKKYDENCPTSHNMDEPVVNRVQYTIVSWDDNHLCLLDAAGSTRDDLQWPVGRDDKQLDEWIKALGEGLSPTVYVLSACGEEKVFSTNEKL